MAELLMELYEGSSGTAVPRLTLDRVDDGLWTGRTCLDGHRDSLQFASIGTKGTGQEGSFLDFLFKELWEKRLEQWPFTRTGSNSPLGFVTSPIPLMLSMPVGMDGFPAGLLSPWWNLIRLPEVMPSLVAHHQVRSAMFRNDLDVVAGTTSVLESAKDGSGTIGVSDDAILVWSSREFDFQQIAPSGLLGRVVFGRIYGLTRDLASMTFTKKIPIVTGCQIPMVSVFKVELEVIHQLNIPKVLVFPAADRSIIEQRGYSAVKTATLKLFVNDGWLDHEVLLEWRNPKVTLKFENEAQQLVEFGEWIARRIAYSRSTDTRLSEQARTELSHIASTSSAMKISQTTDIANDEYTILRTVTLPGAIPLCVPREIAGV